MAYCKCRIEGLSKSELWIATSDSHNVYVYFDMQTFRPKKKWEMGTLKYELHKKAKVHKIACTCTHTLHVHVYIYMYNVHVYIYMYIHCI